MHVVGEHAARPEQPGLLVRRRVVAAEQLAHPLDLLDVLVEVRGEPEVVGTSASSAPADSSIGSVQESEKRGVTA